MPNQKKNAKPVYILALLLFLGGVSWLLYSGFSGSSVYFLNVSEALAATPEKLAQVRLFGTVAENDLVRTSSQSVRFLLEDKDNTSITVPVQYTGLIPDTFKAGAEVIVEGGMAPGSPFKAKTLMTKCPSKYQKENRSKL